MPTRCIHTHDSAKAVLVVNERDGTASRFRDNPARHLFVEPDPETGGMHLAVKQGRPFCIYLCRQQHQE
jgi:hypothetical protein